MEHHGYTTIKAGKDDGVLTITYDYPPVNILGCPMLVDLNILAQKLEWDRGAILWYPNLPIQGFISPMRITTFTRACRKTHDEVELLGLQVTLERINTLP